MAKERSARLRRWYDLIIENADELALLLSREQGKPVAEAKGEIIYGAGFVEFFAEEAKRIDGETMPSLQGRLPASSSSSSRSASSPPSRRGTSRTP